MNFIFHPSLRGFPPFKGHVLIRFPKRSHPGRDRESTHLGPSPAGPSALHQGNVHRPSNSSPRWPQPSLWTRPEGNQTRARGESGAAQRASSPRFGYSQRTCQGWVHFVMRFCFNPGGVKDIMHAVGTLTCQLSSFFNICIMIM